MATRSSVSSSSSTGAVVCVPLEVPAPALTNLTLGADRDFAAAVIQWSEGAAAASAGVSVSTTIESQMVITLYVE